MIRALALAALLLATSTQAIADPAVIAMSDGAAKSVGVSTFDIPSAISGRTYRIQLFKPASPPPRAGYPVFYTTDAFGFFNQAADAMRTRQYTDLKPAIIVGIGYPTDDVMTDVRLRMRDLMPDAPNALFEPTFREWLKPVNGSMADAGGAELFYRFIAEELRPALAAALPVDRANQTLYGHSLGGLFALHVLFNHPAAFSTYAISSPSILVNGRAIVAGEARLASALASQAVHPRILLMCASEENYPSAAASATMGAAEVERWARYGRMTDNVPEMAARLKALPGPADYAVEFKEFTGENHMSVSPASLSRAMTFALTTQPPPLRP